MRELQTRCIVTVATGPYVRGLRRLQAAMPKSTAFITWVDRFPAGSPSHSEVPYAFKAWALKWAASQGYTTLLWADACILPHQELGPLWERIERDGAWISRNGYSNAEWTAESAYADLCVTREQNQNIEHVVATAFGLCVTHDTGHYILSEYLRLAQTKAFCGPWVGGIGVQHRHDQTALSVIAHRAGVVLTSPPAFFAYRGGEMEETFLVADGKY